jgi:hypothetical protein
MPLAAAHPRQGHPFYQQVFDERRLVLRHEVWRATLDELVATVVAVIVLSAVILVRGVGQQ